MATPKKTPRMTPSERRKQGVRTAANPYMTRAAAERRATEGAMRPSSGDMKAAPRTTSHKASFAHSTTANLLDHPTKTVTTAQLREEYGFVVADLRNMGLLAGGLIVFVIILAQVLPR